LNTALPEGIGQPSGLLTDGDITRAVADGFLLEGHVAENIKYSTYELRVGSYDILDFDADGEHFTTPGGEAVRLKPGETARVFAMEELRIPTNVTARVTAVGQIFSSGLAAETTFADPGYDGNFYVTLSNISSKVLTIPYGKPLARVEFYRLGRPVDQPHAGGSVRRPSFVEWASPERLSIEDLADASPTDWLKRIGEFKDSERYDWRHSASSHVVDVLTSELRSLERSLATVQLALYVIGATVVVALVGWLFQRLAPDSVRTQVLNWLVPAICGGALVVVGLCVRSFRKTVSRLVTQT